MRESPAVIFASACMLTSEIDCSFLPSSFHFTNSSRSSSVGRMISMFATYGLREMRGVRSARFSAINTIDRSPCRNWGSDAHFTRVACTKRSSD